MEDTALYRPIIKKSWQLARKKKGLWFLGLFAAILGTGGEYEILTRALINPFNTDSLFLDVASSFQTGIGDGLKAGGNLWGNIFTSIVNYPQGLLFAILVILISLGITLFIFWLAIVSQIGLVRNIDVFSKNKNTTINEGIDFAMTKFWPVVLINIILKIAFFLLFLILGQELLILGNQGWFGQVIYSLSFIIFIIVVFSVSFLLRYQILYLLLKKQSLKQSLLSAKDLFQNNWLVSLEMAFLVFAIYVVGTIITFFVGGFFTILLLVLFYGLTLPLWLTGLIGVIFFIAFLAATFFITAFLSAVQWSAWVLLFNRLNGEEAISKIVRTSYQLPRLFSKAK